VSYTCPNGRFQWAVLDDRVSKRGASDVFGSQPWLGRIRVCSNDLDQPWPRQSLGDANFAHEPTAELAVARVLEAHHFEGNRVALWPATDVHHTHSTLAKTAQELVAAELRWVIHK
jgi:hypothetical protein